MRKTKNYLIIFSTLLLSAILINGCTKDVENSAADDGLAEASPKKSVTAFTVATADGYAAGTTGGAGGSSVTVTNAATFKTAAESTTKQIITVNGNLDLGSSAVLVNSNKTIIGANVNASVKGNLQINNKINVIIQNLNISNPTGAGTGDGIEVSGSTKVYVTKCNIFDSADGNLDIVRASDNVTVSWCKFYYVTRTTHLFCNLIGNGDEVFTDRGKLHVTMHHNWYSTGANQRMPRVRFGYVHCYNNYYGSNSEYYCVGVGNESHIIIEKNCFQDQENPWVDSRNSTSVAYQLTWTGNVFINSPTPTWAVNSSAFTLPYTYSAHTGSAIKTTVTLGAGNK